MIGLNIQLVHGSQEEKDAERFIRKIHKTLNFDKHAWIINDVTIDQDREWSQNGGGKIILGLLYNKRESDICCLYIHEQLHSWQPSKDLKWLEFSRKYDSKMDDKMVQFTDQTDEGIAFNFSQHLVVIWNAFNLTKTFIDKNYVKDDHAYVILQRFIRNNFKQLGAELKRFNLIYDSKVQISGGSQPDQLDRQTKLQIIESINKYGYRKLEFNEENQIKFGDTKQALLSYHPQTMIDKEKDQDPSNLSNLSNKLNESERQERYQEKKRQERQSEVKDDTLFIYGPRLKQLSPAEQLAIRNIDLTECDMDQSLAEYLYDFIGEGLLFKYPFRGKMIYCQMKDKKIIFIDESEKINQIDWARAKEQTSPTIIIGKQTGQWAEIICPILHRTCGAKIKLIDDNTSGKMSITKYIKEIDLCITISTKIIMRDNFIFEGSIHKNKNEDRIKDENGDRIKDENKDKNRFKKMKKEKNMLEQEKIEQERIEQQKQKQKIIQKENDKLEQERVEQERVEQERLEQERVEQERLEQERVEQERLERENQKKYDDQQIVDDTRSLLQQNTTYNPEQILLSYIGALDAKRNKSLQKQFKLCIYNQETLLSQIQADPSVEYKNMLLPTYMIGLYKQTAGGDKYIKQLQQYIINHNLLTSINKWEEQIKCLMDAIQNKLDDKIQITSAEVVELLHTVYDDQYMTLFNGCEWDGKIGLSNKITALRTKVQQLVQDIKSEMDHKQDDKNLEDLEMIDGITQARDRLIILQQKTDLQGSTIKSLDGLVQQTIKIKNTLEKKQTIKVLDLMNQLGQSCSQYNMDRVQSTQFGSTILNGQATINKQNWIMNQYNEIQNHYEHERKQLYQNKSFIQEQQQQYDAYLQDTITKTKNQIKQTYTLFQDSKQLKQYIQQRQTKVEKHIQYVHELIQDICDDTNYQQAVNYVPVFQQQLSGRKKIQFDGLINIIKKCIQIEQLCSIEMYVRDPYIDVIKIEKSYIQYYVLYRYYATICVDPLIKNKQLYGDDCYEVLQQYNLLQLIKNVNNYSSLILNKFPSQPMTDGIRELLRMSIAQSQDYMNCCLDEGFITMPDHEVQDKYYKLSFGIKEILQQYKFKNEDDIKLYYQFVSVTMMIQNIKQMSINQGILFKEIRQEKIKISDELDDDDLDQVMNDINPYIRYITYPKINKKFMAFDVNIINQYTQDMNKMKQVAIKQIREIIKQQEPQDSEINKTIAVGHLYGKSGSSESESSKPDETKIESEKAKEKSKEKSEPTKSESSKSESSKSEPKKPEPILSAADMMKQKVIDAIDKYINNGVKFNVSADEQTVTDKQNYSKIYNKPCDVTEQKQMQQLIEQLNNKLQHTDLVSANIQISDLNDLNKLIQNKQCPNEDKIYVDLVNRFVCVFMLVNMKQQTDDFAEMFYRSPKEIQTHMLDNICQILQQYHIYTNDKSDEMSTKFFDNITGQQLNIIDKFKQQLIGYISDDVDDNNIQIKKQITQMIKIKQSNIIYKILKHSELDQLFKQHISVGDGRGAIYDASAPFTKRTASIIQLIDKYDITKLQYDEIKDLNDKSMQMLDKWNNSIRDQQQRKLQTQNYYNILQVDDALKQFDAWYQEVNEMLKWFNLTNSAQHSSKSLEINSQQTYVINGVDILYTQSIIEKISDKQKATLEKISQSIIVQITPKELKYKTFGKIKGGQKDEHQTPDQIKDGRQVGGSDKIDKTDQSGYICKCAFARNKGVKTFTCLLDNELKRLQQLVNKPAKSVDQFYRNLIDNYKCSLSKEGSDQCVRDNLVKEYGSKIEDIYFNALPIKDQIDQFDQWLSSTNIDLLCKQVENNYPQFHYMGIATWDEFEDQKSNLNIPFILKQIQDKQDKTVFGWVLNQCHKHSPGQHWVSMALARDGKKISCYYYDSQDPEGPETGIIECDSHPGCPKYYLQYQSKWESWWKQFKQQCPQLYPTQPIFNQFVTQQDSYSCGYHSVYFLFLVVTRKKETIAHMSMQVQSTISGTLDEFIHSLQKKMIDMSDVSGVIQTAQIDLYQPLSGGTRLDKNQKSYNKNRNEYMEEYEFVSQYFV